MRIRPQELEISICDVKYHVSLALSVIPRASWGDVARRFTMIRWEIYRRLPLKCQIPCESGRSQAPRRQQELKEQSLVHGLRWDKTCCSKIFQGRNRDRGGVIARSNINTKSSCWIRTMLRVDGTWFIEPCADYWKPIPREVTSSMVVIPSRLSYVDTLPPMREFFKLLKKRWGDVCIEVAKFFASRKLLPVGSVNFCSSLAIVEPVSSFVSRQPTIFSLRTFLSERLDTQKKDIRQIDDSQNNVLSKLHTLEQGLSDTLRQLEEALRNLIHSAREDGRTLSDVQTIRLNEFRKGVLAHDVEATKEAISHQILDFRAQAQENHNILTDQLGQLVDYINRDGNDKKGEDSSRGPQPPPDDQDRPSGSSGNRGSGGSSGSQRRGQGSGQSKRRRSGGESAVRNVRYGPYPPTGVLKRSAEYWCTGKKDF
ncbi:cleavage and polyadenylation specificity factor subunit 2 [Dorcoceras hygrometricum]|uniref:Cleavage and polyadenylation specificity factor subunit 2 n=1 Tax=Dorcoceras hygrometricum TaxID=472368 RepID=A0A2Z7A2R4_9LAMI|nr:cleavage and polyadenylation specificity factor subunit 2 [Dorcoceras hygrometricum]